MLGLWRSAAPDAGLFPWNPNELAEAAEPWRASARFEVRLSQQGDSWEVRNGIGGEVYRFEVESQALKLALELARQAWADRYQMSCVKVLNEDTWEVIEIFGVTVNTVCPLE